MLRAVAAERFLLAFSVGCGLGAAGATVGQAAALARLVAGVLVHGGGVAASAGPLAVFLAATVVRALFSWGRRWASARASAGVRTELRKRLAQHLVALGPLLVGRERTGELAGTLDEGIERLDAYIADYLPQMVLAAGIPLGLIVLVAFRDPLSALVLAITVPVIPVFMVLIGSLASARARRQWTALARMGGAFLDAIQGLPTLKVLGRVREETARLAAVSERFRETTMGVLRIAFLSALVLELIATLSTAVVAVQVGLRLLYGHLTFEPAFLVLLLAPEVYAPLRSLGAAFHAGTEGTASAERIFDLLDTRPPEIAVPPLVPVPEEHTVRLDGVRFRYPSRGDGEEGPALDGVDLEIRDGSVLALVGPTGAGKSTLAALLLRFALPGEGRITVGGVSLERIDPVAWRRMVAWVPQRPHLLPGTVRDNVRLYRPGAPDREVWAALEAAGLAEEVQDMPGGLELRLGEGGRGLSGGQAQRLAIARAFLADAPIVVMDEPTSHVDPGLEAVLAAAVRRLLDGRTALVIAHRLGTVRRADRIAVLERGRVVQEGTHAGLTSVPGPYRTLLTVGEGA